MQVFCSTHMVNYVGSSTRDLFLFCCRERIVTLRPCLPHLQGVETTVFVNAFPFFSEHVVYGISLGICRTNFAEISDIHSMIWHSSFRRKA